MRSAKKFLYLLGVCILLLSEKGYSQKNVEVGLRMIPQATSIRFTSGVGPGYDFLKVVLPGMFAPHYLRMRAAAGAGIVYNPLRRMRLGADLLYSMEGGGYEERKTNLDYIKVPLWIGFNSLPKGKIIFTVQSGIALSCLIHATLKSGRGETEDISAYLKKTTWGIPLAMGIKFKAFSSYFITAQLYVYSDFSSLSKTNKALGAYNYCYPGIRLCIDQRLLDFKKP